MPAPLEPARTRTALRSRRRSRSPPTAGRSRSRPASNETFASTTSETLTNAIAIIARFQETSTASSGARAEDEPEALARGPASSRGSPPCPAGGARAEIWRQQTRRDAEADRVDQYAEIGPGRRRRSTPPSSVPAVIVSCSASAQQRVRAREISVGDEVRAAPRTRPAGRSRWRCRRRARARRSARR